MEDATPQTSESPETPRDLRAELFRNLSTEFNAKLEADGSLPATTKGVLRELLVAETPTASQIVAAVSKNDEEDKNE